jgi:peptide/nickel transport system permease protein
MILRDNDLAADNQASMAIGLRARPFSEVARSFRSRSQLWVGVFILGSFVVVALAAPLIAPHNPLATFSGHELQGPSRAFPLGADELGRDNLSRLIYGTRASLIVGVLTTAIAATGGVLTGTLAGYRRGWFDAVVMRLWDAVLAVPPIVVGVMIAAFLGPSTTNVALAIGFAMMPDFARVARATTIQECAKEYISAAALGGATTRKIIIRHILPNSLGPLLVQIALAFGFAVLVEAGLSFLGLGTQPPDPSWGGMVAEGRIYLNSAPFYVIFPGLAITVLVLGLHFIANGLRDVNDPRLAARN